MDQLLVERSKLHRLG